MFASTAFAAHRWRPPAYWYAEAMCVHGREGAWADNTGNSYFGGLQFLPSTWYSVGGPHEDAFDHPGDRRHPFTASPRLQLHLAYVVWLRDGRSWREWGTARACGLR